VSSRQQIADSSTNIEWRSDDGSTLVSVPTGVVDRISGYVAEAHKSVPRRGAEAGGVLIGGVRIGPVTEIFITGFEPVPCDYVYGPSFILSDGGQTDFRTAMARHPASEILGYYRSHTRPGFGLESSDRELVARVFPGLSGLILLVKPLSPMNLTGSYFFFQRGNLEMRRVGPEFPFTGSVPGGTPPPAKLDPDPPKPKQPSFELASDPSLAARAPVAYTTAPAANPRGDPPLRTEPEIARRRKSLQWEIVAAGLMIAAALALLWWQYRGDSGEEVVASSHTLANSVASLGLAVQPGEGGWRITWDPNTPSARNSVRGALNVTEEDSRERIPLNAQQIRAGNATYRPVGDDITFRLELLRPDNSVSSETYRVLLRTAETTPRTPPPIAKKSTMPSPTKSEPKPEGQPGEGYVEPEVVNRVAPEVPEGIRPRITAPQPIDVRVSIDSQGRVISAQPLQRGDGLINYLGERAVLAAKQWTFTPAKQGGKAVASSRTIHFVFEQ
jgi:hypothetical protein